MAPRIRLTISKPLPTIRETQEEMLEDVTSNAKGSGSFPSNAHACSSDEYLQSICQLARPAFPVGPENQQAFPDKKALDPFQRVSWFPKPAVASQASPQRQLINIFSGMVPSEEASLALNNAKVFSCPRADPLEQLYAHTEKTWHQAGSVSKESFSTDSSQDSNFSPCDTGRREETHHSQVKKREVQDLAGLFRFPRLPCPRPMERENSFPELKCLQRKKLTAVSENYQTQEENEAICIDGKQLRAHPPGEKLQGNKLVNSSLRRQGAVLRTSGSTEQAEWKSNYDNPMKRDVRHIPRYPQCFHVDKKAVIHSWVFECACAWKGAKVKACLLPAIAEI